MQEEYYRNLYKKDDTVFFDEKNETELYVSQDMRAEQNLPFSEEEISRAVMQLKNNKVCGGDGLPIDLYKVMWAKLKTPFMNMLNEVYEKRMVPNSTSIGIISLIPKAGKDCRFLKFQRPITMLNTDYKVIEKAIANRMMPALEYIIAEDQKGFLPKRRISVNIRKIFDLMEIADKNKMEAFILSLDFMKCFDYIDFSAITGAMNYFNFGQYIIEWTKILYTGFKAMVQNNSYLSKRFSVNRGVHQGGPVSKSYFLCCAEVLANNLRGAKEIKGIPVAEILKLLGQYADDADIYLLNDEKSLKKVFDILEKFKKSVGFTVNYDKTKVYRIGSLKHSQVKIVTEREVQWTNEPINVLGVWISHNMKECISLNYKHLIAKAETILRS